MRVRLILALLVWGYVMMPVRAEHADIDLLVLRFDPVAGGIVEETRSSADREPPLGGLQPRPLAHVKANTLARAPIRSHQ